MERIARTLGSLEIRLTTPVFCKMLRYFLQKKEEWLMRSVSSAEAARSFGAIREEVVTPGAEPVAVTHYNIPQVVVISFQEYRGLIRKSRFAGKVTDLPEEDLEFLATIDRRNAQS